MAKPPLEVVPFTVSIDFAFYRARLQLEGRDQDANAAYPRSNELSVSQIAIGGQQQVQESMKRKETGLTRPD